MIDKTVQIQGVRFLNVNTSRALELLGVLLNGHGPRTVGFVHAHAINVARNDPQYRQIINGFDMVLPDGVGLEIAAWLKGINIIENLNGTDLSPKIFEIFAERKKSIFMLGGRPGIAEKAGKVLSGRYKGLTVCGFSHGYEFDRRENEICQAILSANPDVIMVSMGTPIQEKWIEAHKDLCGGKLFISVGGLFDFIAKVYPRAPFLFRKMKLEWVFRLWCNPQGLWRRYLIGNGVFLFHALREAVVERRESNNPNKIR